MPIPIAAAALAVMEIVSAIREAAAAGKSEITDEKMDGAFDRIAASDDVLSGAIARRRAREAAGDGG